jgi:hypothetical protein
MRVKELERCGHVVEQVAAVVHYEPRLAHEASRSEGGASPSFFEFEERGAAELKGVAGEWRLYAVAGP